MESTYNQFLSGFLPIVSINFLLSYGGLIIWLTEYFIIFSPVILNKKGLLLSPLIDFYNLFYKVISFIYIGIYNCCFID